MDVNVYTDESCTRGHRYMLIGGLWVPSQVDADFRNQIAEWRLDDERGYSHEVKWTKVSKSSAPRLKNLLDIYFSNPAVVFNCIVIDTHQLDFDAHSYGDAELGFYKFYFQLLSRRVQYGDQYAIRTDELTSRSDDPLGDLRLCVNRWCWRENKSMYQSCVRDLRPANSKRDDLMQLADLILGATGAAWNQSVTAAPKIDVIDYMQAKLGRNLNMATTRGARDLNVWKWRPN